MPAGEGDAQKCSLRPICPSMVCTRWWTVVMPVLAHTGSHTSKDLPCRVAVARLEPSPLPSMQLQSRASLFLLAFGQMPTLHFTGPACRGTMLNEVPCTTIL